MVTQIDNYDQVDVFVGLDVGKGEHHAVGLDRVGKHEWSHEGGTHHGPAVVCVHDLDDLAVEVFDGGVVVLAAGRGTQAAFECSHRM